MIVNLHIDRVVVDGVSLERGSERQVRAAVERELSSLFLTRGVPLSVQHSMALPAVSGNTIPVSNGVSATRVGSQIAQAVYQGIGKLP